MERKPMDKGMKETYDRAKELYAEGNYSEAKPLLQTVLNHYPAFADVLNCLGVIASLEERMDDAIKYLERAVEENPNYTEAVLNLAITYNSLGEFEKATETFSKAANLATSSPSHLDPFTAGKLANEHFKLGNLYYDFGMLTEAIGQYERAVELHDGLADVHTKLGVSLREKKRLEDSLSHLKRAKDINENYIPAWIQMGLTHYAMGNRELALAEWEGVLARKPEHHEAKSFIEFVKKGA
jgi:tetratricopeptide (TPR) repeat protein